jgi:hypothetical protein
MATTTMAITIAKTGMTTAAIKALFFTNGFFVLVSILAPVVCFCSFSVAWSLLLGTNVTLLAICPFALSLCRVPVFFFNKEEDQATIWTGQ